MRKPGNCWYCGKEVLMFSKIVTRAAEIPYPYYINGHISWKEYERLEQTIRNVIWFEWDNYETWNLSLPKTILLFQEKALEIVLKVLSTKKLSLHTCDPCIQSFRHFVGLHTVSRFNSEKKHVSSCISR